MHVFIRNTRGPVDGGMHTGARTVPLGTQTGGLEQHLAMGRVPPPWLTLCCPAHTILSASSPSPASQTAAAAPGSIQFSLPHPVQPKFLNFI